MITQIIYLKDYDWLIKVFYEATADDADLILNELDKIDCDPIPFYKLADQLDEDRPNEGFTYSDSFLRITFIVINRTSNAAEFQNTIDHEKGHAATYIATALDIDLESEDFQYLQGKIGQEIFKKSKRFLCDNCRNLASNNI